MVQYCDNNKLSLFENASARTRLYETVDLHHHKQQNN